MSKTRRPTPAVERPSLQETFVSYLAVWVGESSRGGVGVVMNGALVFEDQRWRDLLGDEPEDIRQTSEAGGSDETLRATRAGILREASQMLTDPVGARRAWTYRSQGTDRLLRLIEAIFTVVPLPDGKAVLVVLEDITEQNRLAVEAAAVGRFQSVLARIGALAVSGTPVQEIMHEAVRLTAEALNVELVKILIPRESDEYLYLMAGVGWRESLIGSLTVEGGTRSQQAMPFGSASRWWSGTCGRKRVLRPQGCSRSTGALPA